MRKNGAFAVVVLTAVLSLGPICDGSATAEDACGQFCDCLYFLPHDIETCTSRCVTEYAPMWSQDCLDCVAGSDCFDLESGQCDDVCEIRGNNPLIGENP